MADPTPPPVPTEALECPQCKINPHGEPDEPHIHFTDFGYVLFTPNHELRDYIEEIREFERTAGRTAAAADLRQRIQRVWPDPMGQWSAEQADAGRAVKEAMLRATGTQESV